MFRRLFIKKSFYLLGLTCLLPACGDSDTDSSTDSEGLACSESNPTASIDGNHGHTLTIPISDINSEISNTYTLTTVGHTHTITLSTTDIEMLKDEGSLMKVTTTSSGHSHLITITCVG